MTAVVGLVVAAVAALAVLAVFRTALFDRAEQERQGLFGAHQARIRRTVDEARGSAAAADPLAGVRGASAQLSRLAVSGARITSIGPLFDGWWQLCFADGTTLFVLPADRRACRLQPHRAPTVVQAWSPREQGVDLILLAAGLGTRQLPCRDLRVLPPAGR
jgi:hypothetical protein